MSRRLLALVALVVVAGCSSGAHVVDPDPTLSPDPQRSELVARADLDPCPSSDATPVEGGLPDVTLACLGIGPSVHLAGLRGKPMVVNIWGSWCVPCQKETPLLSTLHDELRGKVRFLGVDTVDDPDSALDFAVHVQPRMRYPSVVDDDKTVLIDVGGSLGPPVTVFVAADGRVVHKKFGEYTGIDSLRSDIAQFLGVQT